MACQRQLTAPSAQLTPAAPTPPTAELGAAQQPSASPRAESATSSNDADAGAPNFQACTPSSSARSAPLPEDQCKLALQCADTSVDVSCDGENDGTGTSLCSCRKDGKPMQISSLWDGEGMPTCYRAAEACLGAKTPESPPLMPRPMPITPQPPLGDLCVNGQQQQAGSERVSCNGSCTSERILTERCELGAWHASKAIEPTCQCRPRSEPHTLAGCEATKVKLRPEFGSPNKYCAVNFQCSELQFEVRCDAERDGTGTSLCDCLRGDTSLRLIKHLWPGEGIDTCYQAASSCLRGLRAPTN